MKGPFAERLEEGPPLLLDGGLGTMLIARGLRPGSPPELWNVERPEDVLAVHRAYVEAGSEAVHTNTFGASPARLAAFGLEARSEELTRAGVDLARRAGAPFVIGDAGPTGEYLPPVGAADEAAWRRSFERQGRAFAEAGVDAIHVETVSDGREARVALDALRAAAPGVPVLVSLTFDRKRRGFFTAFGDRPVEALAALAGAGAFAVGANCSLTSPDMADLAREVRSALATRLVFQPNAGRPEVTPEGVRYGQTAEAFAADMAALAAEGAAAVGGCCGTDPTFIRALRARLGPVEGP